MVVGKVVAHLCLTLIIKELKYSVEHDRVVTTLNIILMNRLGLRNQPVEVQDFRKATDRFRGI